MMQVQLLSPHTLEIGGATKRYPAGSVVTLGRQTAVAFVQRGIARLLDDIPVPERAGVVVTRADHAGLPQRLPVTVGDGLRYPRTLIWDGKKTPNFEQMTQGFRVVDVWQMAIPLDDYETLAADIGTDADRERAAKTLRDLRVMVYQTGMIFARRCPEAERVLERYAALRTEYTEARLALLVALYEVKPLLYPLPAHWYGGKGGK